MNGAKQKEIFDVFLLPFFVIRPFIRPNENIAPVAPPSKSF
jgi:hypothetical protein